MIALYALLLLLLLWYLLTFDMDGVVEAMKDIEKEQSKSDQAAGEGSTLPGVPSDVADMAEKVNEMTETLTQSLGVATEATSRNSAEIIAKLRRWDFP